MENKFWDVRASWENRLILLDWLICSDLATQGEKNRKPCDKMDAYITEKTV